MTEVNRTAFFTLVFALVFYVIGASFIQSFVNYPTWKFIGAYEFRSYHNAMSPLIITTMVLPWFLEIVLTFVLLWQRPRAIPRGAIALAQAFNLIALASTIFIQIPIQVQFGESGMSSDALEILIETDPIRWLSAILKGILYLWMMLRIVTPPAEFSPRSDLYF